MLPTRRGELGASVAVEARMRGSSAKQADGTPLRAGSGSAVHHAVARRRLCPAASALRPAKPEKGAELLPRPQG
jgi:hypothetical protein